jgi:hypothetical protein
MDTSTATISKAPQLSNKGMLIRSKAHALSQSEAQDIDITSSPATTKLKQDAASTIAKGFIFIGEGPKLQTS